MMTSRAVLSVNLGWRSIGMPRIIDETPLHYESGKLVLTLPASHRDLDGERLLRRFDVLAELVDQKAEIRYAP